MIGDNGYVGQCHFSFTQVDSEIAALPHRTDPFQTSQNPCNKTRFVSGKGKVDLASKKLAYSYLSRSKVLKLQLLYLQNTLQREIAPAVIKSIISQLEEVKSSICVEKKKLLASCPALLQICDIHRQPFHRHDMILPNDKKRMLMCQLRLSEEEEILIKDKKKHPTFFHLLLYNSADNTLMLLLPKFPV